MGDEVTLQERVEQLEHELRQLRARLSTERPAEQTARRSNRRSVLKLAAASGIAALATSRPAQAANGDPLVLGSAINTASQTTGLAVTGENRPYGFGVTDNGLDTLPNGWRGAVLGHADRQAFDAGVVGLGQDFADGVVGWAQDGGRGIVGYSGDSGGVGVWGAGGDVGGVFRGNNGALVVGNGQLPPQLRVITMQSCVLDSDFNNDLWWSYGTGNPPKVRKIVGPGTAGALHPVTPVRVYDSRAPQPSPGSISAGQERVISVADGRALDTGEVSLAGAVADGATTVAVNLTITDTAGAGFLALAPGDATTLGASTINWGGGGVTAANAVIVKLDASRQLKVFCGGAGSTQFIVDVQGYWL